MLQLIQISINRNDNCSGSYYYRDFTVRLRTEGLTPCWYIFLLETTCVFDNSDDFKIVESQRFRSRFYNRVPPYTIQNVSHSLRRLYINAPSALSKTHACYFPPGLLLANDDCGTRFFFIQYIHLI